MTKWISVAKQKPTHKATVLAWDGKDVDAFLFLAARTDGLGRHHKEQWVYGDFEVRGVTHWMPLPEPPKQGST